MVMKARPSAMIRPQSGVGGTTPMPKKDRPEASRIAVLIRMPACTSSDDTMLGSRCRRMMGSCGTPMTRAASTNGFALTCSTSERTIRANGPMKEMASA